MSTIHVRAHSHDVQEHGLKWYLRDPNSFTPLRKGGYLLLGRNQQQNIKEIAKFSVWLCVGEASRLDCRALTCCSYCF
jgi:hypothetical protein